MKPGYRRVDVAALRDRVDLVDLIGGHVTLRRSGSAGEYVGLCPFHGERTPSFTVVPAKQIFHCFGCGAHGDAIAWVMQYSGLDFAGAVEALGGGQPLAPRPGRVAVPLRIPAGVFVPLHPVPMTAAPLVQPDGWIRAWNPKRGRPFLVRASEAQVYTYRSREGLLLGHVVRLELSGGRGKITPQITWCVAPDGKAQWTLWPFARPRPLYGLQHLGADPAVPVLVVEGEKCRDAAAAALPGFEVVAWPGGSNGIRHVDWRALEGRDVVLWPDADQAGRHAMLGAQHHSGAVVLGVAQYAALAGASRIRVVCTDGMPKGWDVADALLVDGWTGPQALAWMRSRLLDVEIVETDRRAA